MYTHISIPYIPGKFQFDSNTVGFGISSWLFKIRCNHLPEIDAIALPASAHYWRQIKHLFSLARQAIEKNRS